MKYLLKSNTLSAEFSSLGAELLSLKSPENIDLIWQGKDRAWPGHAPVLFPVCGFIKNNMYTYNDHQYPMSVHGFASKSEFSCITQGKTSITFELRENEESLKIYPFHFSLRVVYSLIGSQLNVDFTVTNNGDEVLPFSIGWHPGFNIGNNSKLLFPPHQKHRQYQVYTNGLIGNTKAIDLKTITLNNQTFKDGGIVLEGQTDSLQLVNDHYSLEMNLKDFPVLVLWGQSGNDFVCIEPWFGMGDLRNCNSEIIDKRNIISLKPGENDHKHIGLDFRVPGTK